MYVASPYAPASAPQGARSPQIRAAEEYAAQLMAAMPGSSATVTGNAFSPSIAITYPGGRTDTIPYSAIVKGVADPQHPQVMPWRQDPNVIQGSYGGPTPAFTPLMPADFQGMTLLLPRGPGLGATPAWRRPGRVAAGTSLGADTSFVTGLFASFPGVPGAAAAPVAPPAPIVQPGSPTPDPIDAPPGSLPDNATAKRQAQDAYNSTIKRGLAVQHYDILPFNLWSYEGTSHIYLRASVEQYWKVFEATYAERIGYIESVLAKRNVSLKDAGIRHPYNLDPGTMWMANANVASDRRFLEVVRIWALLANSSGADIVDREASGIFPTITKWAGYAAVGGVILLGLVALNTILPRE